MLRTVLLSGFLLSGQVDVPLEEASRPAPAPDRWLLMQSLQGTWPGACLDARRVAVSGWTEGAYTAGSAPPEQLPMGFNYEANAFLLQQNWVRVERPVVSSGTTEPTFGFRGDAILPGTDYRFTLSRGLFDYQLKADDGQPSLYGFDPVQFYAELYFPAVANGLDIKVGRMYCQYGVEAIEAPANQLMSHAYNFIYNPFTHTGVVATLQVTPAWSVQCGEVLGPDVFFDSAASPYTMFNVKWAPPGGRNSVSFAGMLGSGRFDRKEEFNNPNILDLVFVREVNSRLTWTLDALIGVQYGVPDIGTADWWGIVNSLTYQVSPRLNATGRIEVFDDIDGNRTGFKGRYTTVTAGLNFRWRKNVIFRPEIRGDRNDESRPFQDKHNLYTATADVIVRW